MQTTVTNQTPFVDPARQAKVAAPPLGTKLLVRHFKVEWDNRNKNYEVDEALALVKETAFAKFDESVDVSVKLGVDPRKADQMVRGAVVLPNGLGKTIRVLVFAKGESPFVGYFETRAESDGDGFYELRVPEGGYVVGAALPGGAALAIAGARFNELASSICFSLRRSMSSLVIGRTQALPRHSAGMPSGPASLRKRL